MDWTNDLEITSKKLLPRLGRRATQASLQEELKSDDIQDNPLSSSSGKSVTMEGPIAPPRTRKTGWSDEFKSSKQKSFMNTMEQERYHGKQTSERDDEIPVIPDLDEIIEDNSISEITHAMARTRVATYKELDTDFLKKESFAMLDDIDLSILAEKLYPEKMINEVDEVWNWDMLFTQITTEINSEEREKDHD